VAARAILRLPMQVLLQMQALAMQAQPTQAGKPSVTTRVAALGFKSVILNS